MSESCEYLLPDWKPVANDELAGAERAGMTALQLRAPGEQLTADGERWKGDYVERLSDVLEAAR